MIECKCFQSVVDTENIFFVTVEQREHKMEGNKTVYFFQPDEKKNYKLAPGSVKSQLMSEKNISQIYIYIYTNSLVFLHTLSLSFSN